MADKQEVMRLTDLAYEMRVKLINLCGVYEGSVHIGGDLSMTDLLIRVSKRAVKRNQRENRVPRSPDGWNNSGLYEFQNGCKPARTQSKQPGDFPAFAENIDFSAPVSEYNGADQR